MKSVLSVLLLILLPSLSASQSSDSLFLRVVIPEQDTVRTPFNRHRIAASTLPTARAFINGREVTVYPSGAFVGLVNINPGANAVRLLVRSATGDSLWKDYVLIRPEPLASSPREPVVIDSAMMVPQRDLWLGRGDILEVRFKGSPGYEASFEIEGLESGLPMAELPPGEAGGLEGVYIGRYVVKETDEVRDARIQFRLRKSFWSSERAYARGRVSILPTELPRVAEVRGRRPFLNAGLGEDRLGGAKLGYLTNGVRLSVTGKVGRQYRVQLADGMTGWLPDDFTTLLPVETPQPRSLVSSLSAVGSATEDIVTVSLGQRLPYLSEQRINPTAIVVDIFGATSNTNWITHHLSASGIQTVAWDQVATDQYRLTITLTYGQHWGYDIGYEGTSLRVRIRRPPLIASVNSALAGLVIAVDAGHGGDNQGALGATGVREMDVTMAVARSVQAKLLERGARVVMTRPDDRSGPGMQERWDAALAGEAQLLVSIHCNSIGYNSDPLLTKGTSTYYRYRGFQPLARILYDKMLELGLAQFGVVGSFNFTLNAPTQFPNVLVETAFLSHPEDEMKLLDDDFRKRMAEKIVEGLEEFVKKYGG